MLLQSLEQEVFQVVVDARLEDVAERARCELQDCHDDDQYSVLVGMNVFSLE